MKLKLAFIVAIFSLTACCTKKECVCDDQILRLKMSKSYDIYNHSFTLLITDKENYSVIIDSLPLNVGPACNGCTIDYHEVYLSKAGVGNRELKDFSYIIKDDFYQLNDTINRIDYEYYKNTFECNSCFLGSDNKTCDDYKDYSITFNRKKYEGREQVEILIN